MLHRRAFLHLSACAVAQLAFQRVVRAQSYPARPVTLVVPFPAGGPTDMIARIFAERLRQALGQSVIVENVAGAGATIGVARVIRAAPDGYTLSAGNSTSHVGGPAIYPFTYDVLNDLESVALLSISPTMLVARKDFPANTVQDLIVWLKGNPGKATGGTSGAGSSGQLASILFQSQTGTRFQVVPYRGAAPAMQDLIGGRIDFVAEQISTALPQIQGSALKAIATLGLDRAPGLDDLPTAQELGVSGLDCGAWGAFSFPKGTPDAIVRRLAAASNEAVETPALRERFKGIGVTVPAPERRTPEYLAKFVASEIERWAGPIKTNGLSAD